MFKKFAIGLTTAAAVLGLVTAYAQVLPGAAGQTKITAPQVNTIGNSDLFHDIPGGNPSAQNYYASGATLQGYIAGNPARSNALIGGDGTTNLWQRGTAGVSSTSGTVQWSSADRWGQAATASAGVKIARDSTAADLPSGYKYAISLTHTNTTAGLICMGQSIETANSYAYQGTTAELDFHAATGAGYTGGSTLTAYIVTGTGTDEGLNVAAYNVSTSLGATGYTGGAVATAAVVPLSAVSTIGRFAAVANIPATATEISVFLCYTAGTTSTNDYVAFDGVQLVRSPQLSAYVSASAGYETDNLNNTTALFQATSFERRPASLEAFLQYRYFYQINEANTANVIQGPGGYYDTTTTCSIAFPLPAPMFKSPTLINSAITATTFKIAPTTTPVVLAGSGNSGAILQVGSTPAAPFTEASVSFKTTTETQYVNCDLVSTAAGAGSFAFNAED